jgi:hypothetical protein
MIYDLIIPGGGGGGSLLVVVQYVPQNEIMCRSFNIIFDINISQKRKYRKCI